MDDSLSTLVNETQMDYDEEMYTIDLNLSNDMREKYSIISLVCCLILNIILIININNDIGINIFLCILNNLFLVLPIIFFYKNKYNKLIKENIVLIILLIISVLFEIIMSIIIDKNKLTLIMILIIKNIILIYYILKVNNLLENNNM